VTDVLQRFGWVDLAMLAVLLVSVAVGVWRGFVFEVMALAGWLVAWFAAQWFAADVAPWLPVGTPGSALNHAAAFVVVFVAALVAWALLARLVRLLVQATPLSLPDRALGAAFGVARAAVLLLAVATVVALTPAAQSPSWQRSTGALWLNTALHGLKPVLPARLAAWLPA
jgi:membrane protein required for colicin V production